MIKIYYHAATPSDPNMAELLLRDREVMARCEEILAQHLANPDVVIEYSTGQELVVDAFRALLFRDYVDIQHYFRLYFEGQSLPSVFTDKMRYLKTSQIPFSVWAYCCDKLLGY